MIPPILHQIWKSGGMPAEFHTWSESWSLHNPGLTRMSWNDRTLLEFVADRYPGFLPTYCGYATDELRANAGRYLLLHHFGGIHADPDCECVAPLTSVMTDDRVVFCRQPANRHADQARLRGLPYLLFNGAMASPQGHQFWAHLIAYLPTLQRAKEATDATGQAVLTSAQISFPDQSSLAIHPCGLFAAADRKAGEETLSVQHRAEERKPAETWSRAVKRRLYRARYLMTRGPQFDLEAARLNIGDPVLRQPAPSGPNIAVLVPVRDAAEHIAGFLSAIESLDYPTRNIKLVFCEGDSKDGTWEILNAAVQPIKRRFRDIVLLRQAVGTDVERATRAWPQLQRQRRSGLARVRNHLIRHGLDGSDDWALWIDIDVWKFPADIVETLVATGERIVVPNCVHIAGGETFDVNSFITTQPQRHHRYYRSIIDGIFQPPPGYQGRLSLGDVRHLERVDLDGVGGTMLLVDASLHRAGLEFPELPYKDLVETEGFGVLAKDLGVTPVGLPRVEIFHVPW